MYLKQKSSHLLEQDSELEGRGEAPPKAVAAAFPSSASSQRET